MSDCRCPRCAYGMVRSKASTLLCPHCDMVTDSAERPLRSGHRAAARRGGDAQQEHVPREAEPPSGSGESRPASSGTEATDRDKEVTQLLDWEGDAPKVFHRPFTSSTSRGEPCVCVGCGSRKIAVKKIESFPNRWLPDLWSVDGHSRAVRCPRCTDDTRNGQGAAPPTKFWETFHVLVRFGPGLAREIVEARRVPSEPETDMHNSTTNETRIESEDPMPNDDTAPSDPTLKDKAIGQAKALGGAVALGGKLIAVNKSSDLILRMAKKLATKSPVFAGMLEDEDGREALKGLIAWGLHSAGTYAPVPERMAVPLQRVGELQVTASTFILGNKYMDLFMDEIEELVKLGESLGPEPLSPPGEAARLGEGVKAEAEITSIEDRQTA